MHRPLRFGSVCSGIEAASAAWESLGWLPVWFAEIEPFPSAVLAHHYPDVPNLGDMTRLPARILAGEIEAPDIFVGGTPCQSFSVAGLRKGLDDPRGQLTRSFVEIADAIDTVRAAQGLPPAIILWENVPGVLSDNGNAFGNFLGALAGEDIALDPSGGKWTNAGLVLGPTREVCWRVLDAQYYGVAQRRRRVFVVASSRTGGVRASQVLLVESGVRRDSPPSREAGQRPAGAAFAGAASGGGERGAGRDGGVDEVYAFQPRIARNGRGDMGDKVNALNAQSGETGRGDASPCVAHVVAPPLTATNDPSRSPQSAEVTAQVHAVLQAQTIAHVGVGVGIGGEVAGTLDASYYKGCGSANYGEREVVAQAIAHPDVSATVSSKWAKGTGGFAGMTEHHNLTATFWNGNDIAETLTRTSDDQRMPDKGRMQMVVQSAVPYDLFQVTAPINRQNRDTTSPCHTLARDNAAHAAVVQCVTGDRTHALKAEGADASEDGTGRGNPIVPAGSMAVRRLVPEECEALQGFPRNWTRIPWKKKPADECPDGPRYKALGNSMAVPCMNWIGRKIDKEYRKRHAADT